MQESTNRSLLFSDEKGTNFNPARPHILLLGLGIFEDYVGGISSYQSGFCRQLVQHGYQVSVVIPRTRIDLPEKSHPCDGITVYRYGSAKGGMFHLIEQQTQAKRLIQQIVCTQQVDGINVHFPLTAWGIVDSPLFRTIPKLMHFHGPWPLEWAKEQETRQGQISLFKKLVLMVMKAIEASVMKHMDCVVLMSPAFQPYLEGGYSFLKNKTAVVPIGWDETAMAPYCETKEKCREMLGIPSSHRVLLTVRRLVKRTGVDMLLEAAAPLLKSNPDFHIYIAGKGPEAHSLKQMAKRCDVEAQVHFLGFVPDEQLPLYYKAADLTCVPTRDLEGFGTVVLESWVQGTPVLATPVGGLVSLLNNFSPALLTTAISPIALKEKLQAWLSGQLILPTAQDCLQHVRQTYHWDTIFPRFQEIFSKIGIPNP